MRWLAIVFCAATLAHGEGWAFKPLRAPQAGSIDGFIRAKLAEKGLQPAPRADERTLQRRLSFDLTGLPPESGDESYEALVDRLLASPRYGERWARHWLDVAHYGETHGYDKDKPRLNAWPYRDYVIRALNSDKPYTRFVQEQIAGDALYPGTVDGITALGFIAAGPWDLIGHMEVPETKLDGKVARHLDRDDMVQNTLGAFCSLTAGCAQCHDHKSDPISQQDYYALQAIFAALDRTEVDYFADDAAMQRALAQRPERERLMQQIKALEAPLKATAGAMKPEFGYHSAISMEQESTKWVQVDLGERVEVARIVLKPCHDDFGGIGAGFGFPVRFKIEVSDDPLFVTGVSLVWRKHDATFMQDFANPGLLPFETTTGGDDGVAGRYVRVTAVKLAPRKGDYIFALAELEVYAEPKGPNIAAGKAVSALDSIEAPPRWRRSNLTDGIAPAPPTQVKDDEALRKARAALAALPVPKKVYAGAVHKGTGNFKGTSGTPRPIHLLKRGEVNLPQDEVAPGTITALSHAFGLSFQIKGESEAARRVALAQWITHADNALTWRSIVNRVWQHHFGQGLVATANDFGRMGSAPSHPELLDWLARWFRDEAKGSLKALHRLIVMSETYRQSSTASAEADRVDASNQWLSHQQRRKLDAECVRDSILAVSGKLDLAMGGPSFQDFIIEKPQHSPHYEYGLHDPEDAKSHRRSIYRFIVRSQPQPFMTVLDCADPSLRVDKRNESLSPLQALAMMNNGLIVTMAKHFAARATDVRSAFILALGRVPSEEELAPLLDYARREGLENACRVILNLNEFSFVD